MSCFYWIFIRYLLLCF